MWVPFHFIDSFALWSVDAFGVQSPTEPQTRKIRNLTLGRLPSATESWETISGALSGVRLLE